MVSGASFRRRVRIPGIHPVPVLALGVTGGLMALCLVERGAAAGQDAFAYWQGARTWLNGGDPYQPAGPWWPYVYAVWLLPLFAPWALLPWPVAWALWRGAMLVLLGWSVTWAYERRPAATALAFLLLAIPIGVVLDSGNVALFLALGIWATRFVRPPAGGFLLALASAMKWFPIVFLPLLGAPARRWALLFLGVAALLYAVTWPATVEQFRAVQVSGIPSLFEGPHGLRVDHLVFGWAAIPWLWSLLDRPPRPHLHLPTRPHGALHRAG